MVIYALVELIVVSIMHRLTMDMNWTFSKPIFEETQERRSIVTLAAILLARVAWKCPCILRN